MNIIHGGKLKHVESTLATGDICDAEVDAIVSSEQTDFVLSGNPQSLSGQIWIRYGDAVQRELDAATNGQVQGAGTVIDTLGGRISNAFSMPAFMIPTIGLTRWLVLRSTTTAGLGRAITLRRSSLLQKGMTQDERAAQFGAAEGASGK